MAMAHAPVRTAHRSIPVCRRPAVVQAALANAPATVPSRAPGSIVDAFVAQHDWAREILAIQDAVHETSLDGASSEFQLRTHRQDGGPISHKVLSTIVLPKLGVVNIHASVHACLPQGTPFLDIALMGNNTSVLLGAFLTPRLSTLLHTAYVAKYYRSLPPGVTNTSDSTPLLTFAQLYARAKARAEAGPGVGVDSTPAGSGIDANPATAPLYRHFHSNQLWTRLMTGHGLLFKLEPSAASLAAVRDDVAALAALWCAWVKADWADGAGIQLEGAMLEECRDMSHIMANIILKDEDDVRAAERMVGTPTLVRLVETMSGEASLAGAPWWAAGQ